MSRLSRWFRSLARQRRAPSRVLGSRVETLEDRTVPNGTPFRVWTQNTQLRPSGVEEVVPIEYIAPLFPPVTVPLVTGMITAYEGMVANTDADNEERTNIFLDWVRRPIEDNDPSTRPYDIIAMQEVNDPDQIDQFRAAGLGYRFFTGPDAHTIDIGFDTLPFGGNSGLGLMVRNALSTRFDHLPLAIRETLDVWAFEHQPVDFQDEGPIGWVVEFDLDPVFDGDGINIALDGEFHDDFLAEKGFTLDTVHLSNDPNHFVYVVNTHLHRAYEATRTAQLHEINEYLIDHTDGRHPVLFMGDFNIADDSDEYRAMLDILGKPDDPFHMSPPGFLTADATRNAYDYFWNGAEEGYQPTRLDYILIRQGSDYRIEVDALQLVDENPGSTAMSDQFNWPGENPSVFPYPSDHFGLSADLRLVASNFFDPATGEVHVEGGPGESNDVITIDRALDNHGKDFLVVTRVLNGGPPITDLHPFEGVKYIVIDALGGNDQINLERIEGLIPVTVLGGAGDDIIRLSPTAQNLTTLIGSVMTLDGGIGTDELESFDQSFSQGLYTITPDYIGRFLSGTAYVTELEEVVVHTGRDSTVQVAGTPVGTTVTVRGSTAADRFNIGGSGRNLDGLAGRLHLVGNGGADVLTFNDQNSIAGQVYQLQADRLDRSSAQTVTWAGMTEVVLNAGGFGDVIHVLGSALGAPVTVNAGGGIDTVHVGDASNALSRLRADVTLDGQAGVDVLSFNDQAALAGGFYTLSTDRLWRSGAAGIDFADFVTIELYASGYTDQIDVEGTAAGTAVTVHAGGGGDTIEVGTDNYRLDPLLGTLTLDAGAGADSVVLYDLAYPDTAEYTLTTTTLSRPLVNLITFDDAANTLENLTVWTGDGDGTLIDVQATAQNTTVIIEGGDGDDTIQVGGPGHDLDTVLGPLDVHGGDGADVLLINDQNATRSITWTLSAGSVLRSGARSIGYAIDEVKIDAALEEWNTINVDGSAAGTAVTVQGGNLSDDVRVRATAASGSVAVLGGGAGDNFIVGSVANSLGSILGAVTLDGQDGYDALALNDQSSSAASTFTIDASSVSRTGTAAVGYAGMDVLTVNGGSGGEAFQVRGTAAGAPLTLNAGGGDDTVVVGSTANKLDTLLAAVTVHGDGHASRDTLTINDQGAATSGAYTIHWSYVQKAGLPDVGYTGIEQLNLNAGTAGDSVSVLGTPAGGNVSLSGGTGIDTLFGADATGNWHLTAMNRGTRNTTFSFSSVENLVGGPQGDRFRFNNGVQLSGLLNGGGGTDTLDFASYSAANPVTVNLTARTASPITGLVLGIERVTGGLGNDHLTGDGADNWLRGGGGNDTMIGGAGHDVLLGGVGGDDLRGRVGRDLLVGGEGADFLAGDEDDDILIGGTTSHEGSDEALTLLMAEWTRTDLPYGQRVTNLRSGTGLSGGMRLKVGGPLATVFHDTSVDSLWGGAGLDWFFANLTDPARPFDQLGDRDPLNEWVD